MAHVPFGLAPGGAAAATKLTFYNETYGHYTRLAVQVPQIVHRQDRQRNSREFAPFRRDDRR